MSETHTPRLSGRIPLPLHGPRQGVKRHEPATDTARMTNCKRCGREVDREADGVATLSFANEPSGTYCERCAPLLLDLLRQTVEGKPAS
jgi:hypothetical protein